MADERTAADTLGEKLQALAAGLTDEERHLLAATLAAAAEADADTSGFARRPAGGAAGLLRPVLDANPFDPGQRTFGAGIVGTTILPEPKIVGTTLLPNG